MAAQFVKTADTGAAYIHPAGITTRHVQTAIRIQFNRTRGQPQHYGCADDAANDLLQRLFTARERLDRYRTDQPDQIGRARILHEKQQIPFN